jgi:hypothetical protein
VDKWIESEAFNGQSMIQDYHKESRKRKVVDTSESEKEKEDSAEDEEMLENKEVYVDERKEKEKFDKVEMDQVDNDQNEDGKGPRRSRRLKTSP